MPVEFGPSVTGDAGRPVRRFRLNARARTQRGTRCGRVDVVRDTIGEVSMRGGKNSSGWAKRATRFRAVATSQKVNHTRETLDPGRMTAARGIDQVSPAAYPKPAIGRAIPDRDSCVIVGRAGPIQV